MQATISLRRPSTNAGIHRRNGRAMTVPNQRIPLLPLLVLILPYSPLIHDTVTFAYPLPARYRYSILFRRCSRLIHLDFCSSSCRLGSSSDMNYCSSTRTRSAGDSNGYPVLLSFFCTSHSALSNLHWSDFVHQVADIAKTLWANLFESSRKFSHCEAFQFENPALLSVVVWSK